MGRGWIATLTLAWGCGPAPGGAPLDAGTACAEAPPPETGAELGEFALRQYWVADERNFPAGPTAVLCDTRMAVLGFSTGPFVAACRLQGTCRLLDGRLVNVAEHCDCPGGGMCFRRLDARRYPWGKGTGGRPLVPFRSVAVDRSVIEPGRTLYVPELAGLPLPDGVARQGNFAGEVHDGCVRADDTGGNIRGRELDLFTRDRRAWRRVIRRLPERVTVLADDPRCQTSG